MSIENAQVNNLLVIINDAIHAETTHIVDPDWNCIFELAKEQHLFPIVALKAKDYDSFMKYPQKDNVEEIATQALFLQMRNTALFLNIYEKFLEVNIEPIVLKGIVCRDSYGMLGEQRMSSDEDIWISIEEFEKVSAILKDNSFFPKANIEYSRKYLQKCQAVPFYNVDSKMLIEVHINLFDIALPNYNFQVMNSMFSRNSESTMKVSIYSTPMRIMNHHANYLFLILHAFKHFIGSGVGLRQMLDILFYQKKYGESIDMDKIEKQLQDINAHGFWYDVLTLGNRLFGFEIDDAIIKKSVCPEVLLKQMIDEGVYGRNTEADKYAQSMIMSMVAEHVNGSKQKSRVSIIVGKIFVKPNVIYLRYPMLNNNPLLLPWGYIKRFASLIGKLKKSNRMNLNDMNLALNRRVDVLKQYDLL